MPSPDFTDTLQSADARRDGHPPGGGHGGQVMPPRSRGDALIIALKGDIGAAEITRLEARVAYALARHDRVVVDLHDVTVLGTPALAMLCARLRHVRRPGATIVIAGAPPPARRALQLCELAGVQVQPPFAPDAGATDRVAVSAQIADTAQTADARRVA